MIIYFTLARSKETAPGIGAPQQMSTDPVASNEMNGTEPHAVLGVLGERVRALRGLRCMTRRTLSKESGVSERYLAQLEQGRGNMSVLLLARVAAALNTDIADLLRMRKQQSAEEVLISDLLRELSPDTRKACLQMVSEQFAVPVESRRRIALIGLRGGGKTTLGRLLAGELDLPFIHLGSEIEQLAGMSTSEIFSLSGQTGYLRLEDRALMQTLGDYDRCVLETGGSIVLDQKLLNTLLTTCFVVWLYTEPEEYMRRLIAEGDVRPMQNQSDAMSDLRRILAEREEYYAKAHASIDTTGKTVEVCFEEMLRLVPQEEQISRTLDA